MSAGSLLGVDLEREVQEIPKHRGQVLLVLDLRRAIGRDEPKGSERRFGQVWRFTLEHLDRHNTE